VVYRKLNKAGRYGLYSSPYIRKNKLKSVRWAQHIVRMRSGCRWEGNIKMDLKDC